MVSIIISFYNEEVLLKETLENLLQIVYPKYEIILINDGSTDKSKYIALAYSKRYSKIRLIDKPFNEGKSSSLNEGILAAKGDILLFMDADAVVDKNILRWIVPHFVNGPRVGSVTGNPIVRNRVNIITRVQTAEYSSIISLVKRAQRIVGKIFTVSGVVSAYRRIALFDAGFFDVNMATEDIDMSWRVQKRFWEIRFEPSAVVWIMVPDTIRALYQQRLRWALGGLQVLVKHINMLFSWKNRRFWPIYLDNVLSIFWAFNFYFLVGIWFIGTIAGIPVFTNLGISPFIQWYGSILALTLLAQMTISAILNLKYDRTLIIYFFWAAWYPVYYWVITSFAVIVALPLLVFGKRRKIRWLPARRKIA